jgi:hypothetical protein
MVDKVETKDKRICTRIGSRQELVLLLKWGKAFLIAVHETLPCLCAATAVHRAMEYNQESFTSMAVTPAPAQVPNQRPLVPSVTSVVG